MSGKTAAYITFDSQPNFWGGENQNLYPRGKQLHAIGVGTQRCESRNGLAQTSPACSWPTNVVPEQSVWLSCMVPAMVRGGTNIDRSQLRPTHARSKLEQQMFWPSVLERWALCTCLDRAHVRNLKKMELQLRRHLRNSSFKKFTPWARPYFLNHQTLPVIYIS